MCRDSNYKEKTVSWPSYLYNRNAYTDKTAYLFWDSPLMTEKSRASEAMVMTVFFQNSLGSVPKRWTNLIFTLNPR